jgi:Bardet-Biedl syndrome 9 protein
MPGTSNAAGFLCYGGRGSIVTVLAAKSSQRYRLQCDSLPSLCLFTSQLVERLNRHFARDKDFICSYSSSLPVHELFSEIGTHFAFREKARKIQVCAPIILYHKYHYIVLGHMCFIFTLFIAVNK